VRRGVIGSAGSSEGRRQTSGLPCCSGGSWERTSGGGEETKSAAGQRNLSGRRGSGCV